MWKIIGRKCLRKKKNVHVPPTETYKYWNQRNRSFCSRLFIFSELQFAYFFIILYIFTYFMAIHIVYTKHIIYTLYKNCNSVLIYFSWIMRIYIWPKFDLHIIIEMVLNIWCIFIKQYHNKTRDDYKERYERRKWGHTGK